MSVTGQLNKLQLTLLTEDKAEFKVALCNRTSANKCDPIEEQYVTAGTVSLFCLIASIGNCMVNRHISHRNIWHENRPFTQLFHADQGTSSMPVPFACVWTSKHFKMARFCKI